MQPLSHKLCSTKLIVILVVIILATIFLWLGTGDARYSEWTNFMKWAVGLFVAGNITSKIFRKKDKDAGSKS
jgi:hypothetical protein